MIKKIKQMLFYIKLANADMELLSLFDAVDDKEGFIKDYFEATQGKSSSKQEEDYSNLTFLTKLLISNSAKKDEEVRMLIRKYLMKYAKRMD